MEQLELENGTETTVDVVLKRKSQIAKFARAMKSFPDDLCAVPAGTGRLIIVERDVYNTAGSVDNLSVQDVLQTIDAPFLVMSEA